MNKCYRTFRCRPHELQEWLNKFAEAGFTLNSWKIDVGSENRIIVIMERTED